MCIVLKRFDLKEEEDKLPEKKHTKTKIFVPTLLMLAELAASKKVKEESDDDFDLDDFDFEENKSEWYCQICNRHTGHGAKDCPDKATGMGIYCFVCKGPCKDKDDEEHKKTHFETVRYCRHCNNWGKHWSEDCPDPDESDDDFGEPLC